MSDLGIGIIGLHNHYHAFPMANYLKRGIPGLRLVAVSDERADVGEAFAREYCGGNYHADSRQILRRGNFPHTVWELELQLQSVLTGDAAEPAHLRTRSTEPT